MPETALVTGASGFLGAAICRRLCHLGHPVRALHRPMSNLSALVGLPLELHAGDILQPDSLRPAMEGVTWVFHAAAESAYWRNPELVTRAAVEGTRNVLHAAAQAGAQRLVLTSSLAAMGVPPPGGRLTESSTFNLPPKRFPYGHAKWLSEQEALAHCPEGLDLVIVNPSAVFGPGDWKPISGSLIVEAARGLGFVYTDGGWNVVHIDDVVAGHLAAARLGRPGERYLLGGENLTHRQTLDIVAEVVGRRRPWLRLPGWSLEPLASTIDWVARWVTLPMNSAQVRMAGNYLFCDISKSRNELELPPPLPFRQAAQAFWRWWRDPAQRTTTT